MQAEFKEVILVHGIALQGTSPTAHYATKKYTISYKYNEQTIDYNNGKVKLFLKNFNTYPYYNNTNHKKTNNFNDIFRIML